MIQLEIAKFRTECASMELKLALVSAIHSLNRAQIMRKLAVGLVLVFCCVGNFAAASDDVVYSNVQTFTRFFRNASDVFVWDDLQPVGGGLLTGVTLVANNSRPSPSPGAVIDIEFRQFDNSNGGPLGSLIGYVSVDMRGLDFTPGNTSIVVDDLAHFQVVLPQNQRIAVGVKFNDPTLSMGVVTFDPPSVGTSTGAAWVGTDPLPIMCEGIVGSPVPCSFGWELRSAVNEVFLDIKPGSDRNPINLRSKGNIPVAILTSDAFDATQVNWETVQFGPSGASERHERVHVKDADYDGDMDVVLHFKTRDTGILCGDTEATLTGETFAGDAFTGSDVIKIVKCPKTKKRR